MMKRILAAILLLIPAGLKAQPAGDPAAGANAFYAVYASQQAQGGGIPDATERVRYAPVLSARLNKQLATAAIASEDIANYSALNPAMGTTLRKLAELKPRTLALMHGPAFTGDCVRALHDLADDYDRRLVARMREFGVLAAARAA